MESVILFAAFLPPAEFQAFDPPAVVQPAGPRLTADGLPADPAPSGTEWKRYPGQQWQLYPVAKEVSRPAAATFRGGFHYDPDHRCDNCGHESDEGTGTWLQRGNYGRGHLHTCPRCGATWYH